MRPLLGLLVGCGVGVSVLLAFAAFRPVPVVLDLRDSEGRSGSSVEVDSRRAVVAVAVGVGVLLVFRWPVVAVAAVVATYCAPGLVRGDGMSAYIARTEAVATWLESLRDSMSASRGLEGAIRSTALSGPIAIRPELLVLVDEIDGGVPMRDALVRLSDRLNHSVSDLAIATLVMAVDGDAVKINPVLNQVAESSREMAANSATIYAQRASARTATRLTIALILLLVPVLFLMFRDFLAPYATPVGQVALAMFLAGFGVCLYWIHSLSKHRYRPRLIRPGALSASEVAR